MHQVVRLSIEEVELIEFALRTLKEEPGGLQLWIKFLDLLGAALEEETWMLDLANREVSGTVQ